MKLDVKVNKNSISFIGETGEIFNIEKNASLDLNDFINFIEDEHKFYYSKCDYRIVREYTPVESPRKSDDFSKMIVIDGAIRIDEHNYITRRQFLIELAGKADPKALKDLNAMKCFQSIYIMTEAEYLSKLLEISRKEFLVLPIIYSGVSESDEGWSALHCGYIYVS